MNTVLVQARRGPSVDISALASASAMVSVKYLRPPLAAARVSTRVTLGAGDGIRTHVISLEG